MKMIFFTAAMMIASVSLAQNGITALKTTHISIFKNGTYFIAKEGQAKPVNGMFTVTPPSNVLNGTFWLATGKENKIKSITVRPDIIKINRPVESIGDFIQANTGKFITIILPPINTGSNAREIKGTVLSFTPLTQTLKMKTTEGKILFCNVENLREAYGDVGNGETIMRDSVVRMAKVQLENNPTEVSVSTVSMLTGMSWTPSYFLKLTDGKNAKLDLKATILNNDDEPIKDAAVDLVIGNPQMFYGTKLDDIATDFLNRQVNSTYQIAGAYANNVMQVQNDYEEKSFSEEMPAYDAAGEKTNDLFYFNLGKFNLEGQSKTIVPLKTTAVSYEDLYELDIEDYNNYWNNRNIVNDPKKIFTTWHILKIKNTSNVPFTTGPIFVIDEKDRPLAQDEIKYTAMGASLKIRLSKALDVNAKNIEELVNTAEEKRMQDGHEYTVAKISGKLSVTNYQAKSITINISKSLTGKVLKAADGKVEFIPSSNNYRNLLSTIRWEKEIAANQTLELSYQYEVLIW